MLSFADLHAGYIIMADFMHGSVLRLGIALFLTQNAVNYFWLGLQYKYAPMQFKRDSSLSNNKVLCWESGVLVVFADLLLTQCASAKATHLFCLNFPLSEMRRTLLIETFEAWCLRKLSKRCNEGSIIWWIFLEMLFRLL